MSIINETTVNITTTTSTAATSSSSTIIGSAARVSCSLDQMRTISLDGCGVLSEQTSVNTNTNHQLLVTSAGSANVGSAGVGSTISFKKPSKIDKRLNLLKFFTQFSKKNEKFDNNFENENELRIVSTWNQNEKMIESLPSVESFASLPSEMSLTSITSDRSLTNLIKDDYFKVVPPSVVIPEDQKQKKKRAQKSLTYDKKTGIFLSVFNLINDVLSPGTLSMSQMTAQSGIFSSLLLTLFFGLVTLFTLMILYELRRKHLKTSLLDMSQLAFGKVGVVITSIPILLFNFGGALGMFIMFGHLVPDLLLLFQKEFPSILVEGSFLISRECVLIVLLCLMVPFALRKNLGSYAITSFLAVSSVLVVGIWLAFEKMIGRRSVIPSSPTAFDVVRPEILSAFGALAFIYVCHDIVFHIFSNLRRPSRFRFFLVALSVVIITILTIVCVGMSGYLIFYDKSLEDANVLNLFPYNDPMAVFARIIISINIVMSIPYALFMPRDCLRTLLKTVIPKVHFQGMFEKTRFRKTALHVVLTMFVLLSSFGVAMAVTDLGVVADLCGAVAASSLAYIIPPSLYLKLEFSFGLSLKRKKLEETEGELDVELATTGSNNELSNVSGVTIAQHPLEEYYAKKSELQSVLGQVGRIMTGLMCVMVLLLGVFILVGTITSVVIHKFL